MRNSNTPAMVPAPALAVGAPALAGAVMCTVSLVASAQPMRIDLPKISFPKFPDVSLPSLPDLNLDLPNFGKKTGAKAAAPKAKPSRRVDVGRVKVRPAKGVIATGATEDAPTLAEIRGRTTQETIEAGEGYKKFPERRMPGANMDGWKKIAKDITPSV